MDKGMVDCLRQAAQENNVSAATGIALGEAALDRVMAHSLNLGPRGFSPETLWRAIEIALGLPDGQLEMSTNKDEGTVNHEDQDDNEPVPA